MTQSMLANVSAQQGQKKVGLYCSHTDESYIPGDGTEAKPEHGGIIDVANSLADALNKKGVDAVVDDTSHDPHDAGAYRRSRSSAMNLMESEQPDLLLDIHRDGVPDAKEYDDTINGTAGVEMQVRHWPQQPEQGSERGHRQEDEADRRFDVSRPCKGYLYRHTAATTRT